MARVLIDADGCPVVNEAIKICKKYSVECIILCDTSHVFNHEGVQTITVSKGADSVDFALVNSVKPGDIVITQDYGLAAMCLARNAKPISQNGMLYTTYNIDGLLAARHVAKKIRNAGGRLKGPKPRSAEQNTAFCTELETLLKSKM